MMPATIQEGREFCGVPQGAEGVNRPSRLAVLARGVSTIVRVCTSWEHADLRMAVNERRAPSRGMPRGSAGRTSPRRMRHSMSGRRIQTRSPGGRLHGRPPNETSAARGERPRGAFPAVARGRGQHWVPLVHRGSRRKTSQRPGGCSTDQPPRRRVHAVMWVARQ